MAQICLNLKKGVLGEGTGKCRSCADSNTDLFLLSIPIIEVYLLSLSSAFCSAKMSRMEPQQKEAETNSC